MTDDELRNRMACHIGAEPSEATFAHWAELSGKSAEEVRELFRALCSSEGAQRAGPQGGVEIDPYGISETCNGPAPRPAKIDTSHRCKARAELD